MREEIERARGLLASGQTEDALTLAKRLYARRRHDANILILLKDIYEAQGAWKRAAFFACLVTHTGYKGITVSDAVRANLSVEALKEQWVQANIPTAFAPYYDHLVERQGELVVETSVYCGMHLPPEADGTDGYWVGLYNRNNASGVQAKLIALLQKHMHTTDKDIYHSFVFDLIRAQEVQDATVDPAEGQSCVVPIVGTAEGQRIRVCEADGREHMGVLAKYEPYFLRLSQTTHFSLPQDADEGRGFAIGRPIPLVHSPKRKKLVLNILADGLSWAQQKRENYANIPHIMRFFSKGTIFQHAFSQSEYTYPSQATIETGMHINHSQLFHPTQYAQIEPEYITMPEQMQRLGYYCMVVQGDAAGVYNGATRGYDRQLISPYVLDASTGVARTIEQLRALEETDQFLFLHVDEPHPNNNEIRLTEATQTHMTLGELFRPAPTVTSVFLEHSARNIYENRSKIAAMDRELGALFDYIETHYGEDEYVVHLYSDHGCSIYSERPWILSEDHGNIALMMRGGGVPHAGFVDELVSTADIYKIVGHNAGYPIDGDWLDGNLPEVLGGKRREYTMSFSIYPGQTHKICLRTETHEFCLETATHTRDDGTAQLEPFVSRLTTRPDHRRIDDAALMEYFLEKILTDPYCMLEW